MPEDHDLHTLDGEFLLRPISKPLGWPDVITAFLRSLTEHWHGELIFVVFSGYDGDGSAKPCRLKPFPEKCLDRMDTYWRTSNFLAIGQIYLYNNQLINEPRRSRM